MIKTDDTIDKLCQKIYKSHRQAIDRIIEAIPQDKQIYEYLNEQMKEKLDPKVWESCVQSSYCSFFKREWKNSLKSNNNHPFIHYEFCHLDRTIDQIEISLHIEKWGGKQYDQIYKEIGEKPVKKLFRIDNITESAKDVVKEMTTLMDSIVPKIEKAIKSLGCKINK